MKQQELQSNHRATRTLDYVHDLGSNNFAFICRFVPSGSASCIDGQNRAGDVAGFIAHQEFHGIADILDLRQLAERAAQRLVRLHLRKTL
jgi:hypothetical protein